MSSPIKKVAIAGGNGSLGVVVVPALANAGFKVTALVRAPGKIANLPSGAREVVVDYTSPSSVAAALQGQDAVVSTLGPAGFGAETALVESSARPESTVRRFLPAGFGCDLERPEARTLPVYADKFKSLDRLRALEGGGGLSWTSVVNNAFLDWGLKAKFLVDPVEGKATLWDGGEHRFGVTRLAAVAQAVVGVLRHPEETKNRSVYVQEAAATMKQLVAIVQELNPEKKWTVVEASTLESVKQSNEALAKGNHDIGVFLVYIFRAAFGKGAGNDFVKNDNQLLGVKELSEAELKEAIRETLAQMPGAL